MASTPGFSLNSFGLARFWGNYLNFFLPREELMGAVSCELFCICDCLPGTSMCDTVSGCTEDTLISDTGHLDSCKQCCPFSHFLPGP